MLFDDQLGHVEPQARPLGMKFGAEVGFEHLFDNLVVDASAVVDDMEADVLIVFIGRDAAQVSLSLEKRP